MSIRDTGTRWEYDDDGSVVAWAAYAREGDRVVFTHTVVEPAVEGRGIGSALVAHAVGDARERGLEIVPVCSFVSAWLARHP